MRATGNALLAYAHENRGQFPPTLDALASINSFRTDDLYCPTAQSAGAKNANYVYAGAGLSTAAPPECVLLYEPLDFHDYKGVNVLFVDGRVQFIGEIEAGKAVPKLRKGKNPPWTGSAPYTSPPTRPPTTSPADTADPTTTPAGPAEAEPTSDDAPVRDPLPNPVLSPGRRR
jgi:prepilin-type processing-associated H-X9-DG protein